MEDIFKIGNVVKTNQRTRSSSLFVLVIADDNGSKDQTADQFRGVILFQRGGIFETIGEQYGNFNKSCFEQSSFEEIVEFKLNGTK